MTKDIFIAIRATDRLRKLLKVVAKRERRTMSQVIEIALVDVIKDKIGIDYYSEEE